VLAKIVMFSQEEQDTIRLRWTNVNYEDERRLGLDGTAPLAVLLSLKIFVVFYKLLACHDVLIIIIIIIRL